MVLVLKQTWALMLGMLFLMLGNGLQGSLLGVRGSLEQIDTASMGFIMAGYFIGFLGGSKLTPVLLGRVGHVRVFAALGSLVSAAFILYAAVIDVYAWFALRVLVGFCFSGIYVVAESWLNNQSTNETRGQAMSLYLMVQMGGIIAGQLLLNVADPGGYDLFVLITVLVSVSFAPILLSSSPAPMHQTARSMGLRELIKTSPLGCFGMLVLGGIFAALFAMSSIYATERGMTVRNTSFFITAIFLGGMVFQYPIGWLSDRMDRRVLIIIVTAVGSTVAFIAMLYASYLPVLLVSALLLGGTSNPLYSLLVAYTNDYLEPDQMAAAAGGLLFINGFGAMSGPVVVGYAMSHFGIEWFFIIIMCLMSLICLYGVYRMSRRAHQVRDEPGQFLPISSRTTSMATGFAIEVAGEERQDELEEHEEIFEDRLDDNAMLDRLDPDQTPQP